MQLFGRVDIEPFEHNDVLNAIIETPKGSRNKFKYDPETGMFELSGVLPVGAMFPFDFGFIPGTLAEDGDPLDVLLLMDEPAFPGCLVKSKLIGAIKAEQSDKKTTTRNDRLIAVAEESLLHQNIESLEDVNDYLLDQIEHFFSSYNAVKGKEFKALGRCSRAHARKLVRDAEERYRKSNLVKANKRAA